MAMHADHAKSREHHTCQNPALKREQRGDEGGPIASLQAKMARKIVTQSRGEDASGRVLVESVNGKREMVGRGADGCCGIGAYVHGFLPLFVSPAKF